MRKSLKIIEHISLDGVIQMTSGPEDDFPYGDWTAPYRSACCRVADSKRDVRQDLRRAAWAAEPTTCRRASGRARRKSPMADRLECGDEGQS